MNLPSRPNSFGNDVEKDTAGCRAFFRNHIAGGIKPIYDKDITAMSFASRLVTPLQKERPLSTILTIVEKRYRGHHQRKEQKGGFSSKSVSARPRIFQ